MAWFGPRVITGKVCIVEVGPRLAGYKGSILVRRLPEFLDLVFILAYRPDRALVMLPDPLCGKSFEIRAPIPLGAAEIRGEIGESGHA